MFHRNALPDFDQAWQHYSKARGVEGDAGRLVWPETNVGREYRRQDEQCG
jgi:hypothetical protein